MLWWCRMRWKISDHIAKLIYLHIQAWNCIQGHYDKNSLQFERSFCGARATLWTGKKWYVTWKMKMYMDLCIMFWQTRENIKFSVNALRSHTFYIIRNLVGVVHLCLQLASRLTAHSNVSPILIKIIHNMHWSWNYITFSSSSSWSVGLFLRVLFYLQCQFICFDGIFLAKVWGW